MLTFDETFFLRSTLTACNSVSQALKKGAPRIMKKSVLWLAKLTVFVGILSVSGLAQDFQNSYELGPEGRISIANVSGNIKVTGHGGSVVQVMAYFEGPDSDLVEVEDLSSGNSVELKARYPRNQSCNASIHFQVQVPFDRSFRFDSLKTASGNIELTQVMGEIDAKSASGNLTIHQVDGNIDVSTASGDVVVSEAVGTVRARSASGDVDVEILSLQGEGRLVFSTASGDVHVRAPASLDAEVMLSTASGKLQTDFPLTIEDKEGPGKKAYGTLGGGSRALKISSASGNVSLLRTGR
jgi:DUF4097 and DUF4098 domain-containing protein YvlB